MLAMALFPDVQKKAQAEIDLTVGPTRLPDFHDLESLVYVKALVMETLRWMPSAPLGLPHRVTDDDSYLGFYIQKDTMILPVSLYRITTRLC